MSINNIHFLGEIRKLSTHQVSYQELCLMPGVILEGDLEEKVSLSWLTSPYIELREK